MCTRTDHDGACEDCQQTDDYGTAWRNPEFRAPDDAVTSTDRPRPATETRAERDQAPTDPSTPERASTGLPALTVAAFQAALRRDGGAR